MILAQDLVCRGSNLFCFSILVLKPIMATVLHIPCYGVGIVGRVTVKMHHTNTYIT